jgi:hypothetical protein
MAVFWVGAEVGENDPELMGGLVPISNWTIYDAPQDLALFLAGLLKEGEPVRMPIVPLSSRPPKIGEIIATVGYPKFSVESDTSTSEQPEITVDYPLHVATGKVVDRFFEGRDAIMLPFPGFQTDAVLQSGMSGGPIFHRRGYVCGVSCFSSEPDDNYPRYSSYASLALALYPLCIKSGKNSYTVYELVKRGYVFTDDDFDRLRLSSKMARS